MTIYQDMLAAGITCSNWQSDLYVPVTPETRAIVAKYPKQSRSIFNSNIDGRLMYDLSFAFDPYWEQRCAK